MCSQDRPGWGAQCLVVQGGICAPLVVVITVDEMEEYGPLGIDDEELADLHQRLEAANRLVSPTRYKVGKYLSVFVGAPTGFVVAALLHKGVSALVVGALFAVVISALSVVYLGICRDGYEDQLSVTVRGIFAQPTPQAGVEMPKVTVDRAALLSVVLTHKLPGYYGVVALDRRQHRSLRVSMFRPIPVRTEANVLDWSAPVAPVVRVGAFIEAMPLQTTRRLDPVLVLAFLDRVERAGDLGVLLFKVARLQRYGATQILASLVTALSVIGGDEFSKAWMVSAAERVLDSVKIRTRPSQSSRVGFTVEELVDQVVLLRA